MIFSCSEKFLGLGPRLRQTIFPKIKKVQIPYFLGKYRKNCAINPVIYSVFSLKIRDLNLFYFGENSLRFFARSKKSLTIFGPWPSAPPDKIKKVQIPYF
jgi:hypothetical protein